MPVPNAAVPSNFNISFKLFPLSTPNTLGITLRAFNALFASVYEYYYVYLLSVLNYRGLFYKGSFCQISTLFAQA